MTNDIPVPGTVQLVDLQGIFNLKHEGEAKDIVLVPQPTDDPDDPLRWSTSRKRINVAVALLWCFFDAAIISGLSPAYLLIEKDTGISVADLSTGNGILFLFLGWGTLVTQCLALNYGRRVMLVLSILLSVAVSVWTAHVRSRGEFFANRMLLGILCSPQETLIEVVIGDIFFAHDRGFYMGAYSWTLWCGAFLAPVASGYVAQELGWRWIQYIMAIIGAGVGVITFFFFEETMFYREHNVHDVAINENTCPDSVDETKKGHEGNIELATEDKVGNLAAAKLASTSKASTFEVTSNKVWAPKLKLWGFHDPRQPSAFTRFFLPFQMLYMFPGMIFGGFLVGGILAWYNVVGGSLALILGNAPYNFSANDIGLTYLASVLGVTIGCFLSGWLADALAVRLARRNAGVMEPEHRLWTCIFGLVMHPIGCLLYGVGASYEIHWSGVVTGLGLISITLPMGSNLAFTYILDSYTEVAGEGLVSAILIRNLMGFAFGYAVVPMIHNLGLRYAFVLIAVLGFILWCSAIVMIFFGKSARRATAQRYWNLIERLGAVAH